MNVARRGWSVRPGLVLAVVCTAAVAAPMSHATGTAPGSPIGSVAAGDTLLPHPATAALLRLPLRFEPNVGFAAAQADFVARGAGYAIALHDRGAVLALRPAGGPGARVALELVGSRAARGEARDLLPGRSHYFLGQDPAAWRRDVRGYGRVVYSAVYPGIDLLWHGRGRSLEYDFVVKPGADPGAIRLRFGGAERLELRDGELVLHTSGGELVQPRPFLYQETPAGRRAVTGGYVLERDLVGFEIGAYDERLPLVIDPVLVYSTFLGGGGEDFAEEVDVDPSGFAYLTGETASSDFPLQAARDGTLNGTTEAFVTKLGPTGALVYSTFLGGNDTDHGRSIAVDGSGNAYVTGTTRSTNFPLQNAEQPTKGDPTSGFADGFVTKLDATGATLVFSTYLGGDDDDVPFGIAVDGADRAVVGGYTESSDFPTQSAFQANYAGGLHDAFVTKYAAAGTSLVYSSHLGGSAADRVRDVASDAAGNAYLAGDTQSANFLIVNARQPTFGGQRDAFVAKVSPAGALSWSTFHGGTGLEEGTGVDVDGAGSVYVTGFTASSAASFPLANAVDATLGGSRDAFLSKFASNGASLAYSTYIGGSAAEEGRAVGVDPCRRPFVVGETASSDFPLTVPIQNLFGGTTDAFLTAVSPAGNVIVFSTYLGGTGFDTAGGVVAEDCLESVLLVGETQSSNFPRQNAIDNTLSGTMDAFATKVDVGTDAEPDGIPDLVEAEESRDPAVKDNEIFAGAECASGADTCARLFAMQQYRDFLGREGDAGGIQFWTNTLSSGSASRAQVIEAFFTFPEFQTTSAPVIRLYFAYFLRIPDFGGLSFWLEVFRDGTPLESISQFFATSQEFQDTYGSLTNREFVRQVYLNVLDREPDQAGWDFWTEKLDSGELTRGEVMLGFSESDEFEEEIFNEVYVVQMYAGMLQRAADQAGFDFWVAQLDGGGSGLALIQGFLDAPEYHDRFLP